MQKLDGKICDGCRTIFYPGDTIIELCEQCAHYVWCVFNIYEDGKKELSSIHRTEERAYEYIIEHKYIIEVINNTQDNKIIERIVEQFAVL